MPDNAECREMFAEMVERFREAPVPSPLPNSEASGAFLAAEEAVAVMYGWTNRVMRTGEAVLRMDADGFAAEASPLLRSKLEHVIALNWIKEQPDDALRQIRQPSYAGRRRYDAARASVAAVRVQPV
ncbi:hypothetical protein GCM10028801_09040 [Nocardioides maradonensis]